MKNEQGQNTDLWFVIYSRNVNALHLGNLTINNEIAKRPMIDVRSEIHNGRLFKQMLWETLVGRKSRKTLGSKMHSKGAESKGRL